MVFWHLLRRVDWGDFKVFCTFSGGVWTLRVWNWRTREALNIEAKKRQRAQEDKILGVATEDAVTRKKHTHSVSVPKQITFESVEQSKSMRKGLKHTRQWWEPGAKKRYRKSSETVRKPQSSGKCRTRMSTERKHEQLWDMLEKKGTTSRRTGKTQRRFWSDWLPAEVLWEDGEWTRWGNWFDDFALWRTSGADVSCSD